MQEEIELSLKKLEDAFSRLKESVEIASSELEKDGSIQRFEFTFELLWKTLKIFLEEEKGVICHAPKDCLKEAFRVEWIEGEDIFLDMLKDRNRTSHIYNKSMAEEIFSRIKGEYAGAIEKVVKKLKESQK
ncbi:MAG: nucleotidyltransferase [Elusimicrobia bacterium HGW-Elusimicrobia-2]|nr:MAG: nucleotidyltransferase [Elusimicrobia bacterium HGW-Elusimicrobia-2]